MLKPLHDAFEAAARSRLVDWRYGKSRRDFRKQVESCAWFLHFAFINHTDDFDVTADVAVEHLDGKKRIFIVGAELGNIVGTGQRRWNIRKEADVASASDGVFQLFSEVGMPFLVRFSRWQEVVSVFRSDQKTARLISPLTQDPVGAAADIENRMSLISTGE